MCPNRVAQAVKDKPYEYMIKAHRVSKCHSFWASGFQTVLQAQFEPLGAIGSGLGEVLSLWRP